MTSLAIALLLGTIVSNAPAAERLVALRSQSVAPAPDTSEAAQFFLRSGGGPLDGVLVRTTSVKRVQPVAHAQVLIIAATDYAAWFAGHAVDTAMAGFPMPLDAHFRENLVQTAVTGDDGSFRFESIPDGPYYLVSAVDVTYGKANPMDDPESGYDGNGRSVTVQTPALDFSQAHREFYSYLYAFSVTGSGAAHLGQVHESKRIVDPPLGDAAPRYAGEPYHLAATYRYPLAIEPRAADLAAYAGTGAGSISGRLNLPLHGTTARLEYAQYEVFLLPAVQWSYAWAYTVGAYATNNGQEVQPWTPWTDKYLRTTKTDSHGNFSFNHLPSGKYIVLTYLDTVVSHSHTTDSVTSDMTYEPEYHYQGEVGTFGEVYDAGWTEKQSWVDTHHYSTMTFECNIDAALGSVVMVPASGSVTAPMQSIGWDYTGDCERN